MKKVFICSPFRADTCVEIGKNIALARRACRHAIEEDAIPIAPHIYFTQFLDDDLKRERDLGIAAGIELLKECDELWIVGDHISEGMAEEIARAKAYHIPVRHMEDITRSMRAVKSSAIEEKMMMKETKMARISNAEQMAKMLAERIVSNAEHNHRDLKGHEGELTIRVDGDYDREVVEKILFFFATELRDWADENDMDLALDINQADYGRNDDGDDSDDRNDSDESCDSCDGNDDDRDDDGCDDDHKNEDLIMALMNDHREEFEKLKPLIAAKTGYPKGLVGEVLYAEIAVMFRNRHRILDMKTGTREAADLGEALVEDISEFVGVSDTAVIEIFSTKYELEDKEEDDE